MKISRLSLWLTLAIAILVIISSSAGLFIKSIYARETLSWMVQAYGQDIANLVAAAALLSAVYFVSKGSVKAFLVWIGVLLSLLYPYVIYAFDIHFNSLFLVYVALVGLSFYTLVDGIIRLHLDKSYFAANNRARVVSVFLMVVAVLFYFLWFSIFTGTGILAMFLVMSSKGMTTSLGVELFFAAIILVSLVLSVLYYG